MKTTTIIMAAVLALQVNVLLAGNTASSPVATESAEAILNTLAPAAPMEATFEDIILPLDYTALIPLVPAEADFEDATAGLALNDLAPVIPMVAGFDDEGMTAGYNHLAPAVPVEADFE